MLYSPLGETALFVTVAGLAMSPEPSGDLTIKVPARETHNESFSVYNISEVSSYLLVTLKDENNIMAYTFVYQSFS